MKKLRDNRERAKNAITLLWVAIGAVVLGMLIEIYQVKVLFEIRDGDYQNLLYIADNQMGVLAVLGVLGLIVLGAMITCYVFFIRWFRRAYFNMHLLRKNLRYGEGMAAGAWFIPVFNWFGPYQIAKELFTNATELLSDKGILPFSPKRMTILGLWWGLWITSSILSSISGQGDKFDNMDTEIIFGFLGVFASILNIVAGIYAIKMIKEYSALEELLPQLDEDVTVAVADSTDILDSGM